jgi:hypothetical protein
VTICFLLPPHPAATHGQVTSNGDAVLVTRYPLFARVPRIIAWISLVKVDDAKVKVPLVSGATTGWTTVLATADASAERVPPLLASGPWQPAAVASSVHEDVVIRLKLKVFAVAQVVHGTCVNLISAAETDAHSGMPPRSNLMFKYRVRLRGLTPELLHFPADPAPRSIPTPRAGRPG